MLFQPVIDGEVLTGRPIDLIAGGAATDVDVLIGNNAEEYAFFLVPSGIIDLVDDNRLDVGLAMVGADPAATRAVYRTAMPDASPGELWSAAMGDWFFRIPAVRVAEARLARGTDTFVYQFDWPSPQFGGRLGACHALEVAFAFDNLDDPALRPLAGSAPPQALADEMHRAWVSFVKSGDPGWPAYRAERNVRSFAIPSETLSDPGAAQRRVWDGVR
jgi:para-nitrobenzyl esterase